MKIQSMVFATLLLICPLSAFAQTNPQPTFFVNGTLETTLNNENDEALAFNEFRRGDNPFSNLRLQLFGDVVFDERLAIFNQILIDPSTSTSLTTFLRSYLRYTILDDPASDLHIQAGKLPTPFGNFGQRAYAATNPLIGLPLMYHYFTSLRGNQLPADNADLLAHRGQGLSSDFTGYSGGGAARAFSGLPMIYDPCWDFGVEAIGSIWRLEYLVALTQGTLSNPRSSPGDNNDGKQVAAHLGFVPAIGTLIGASYARGPYLDQAVEVALAAPSAKVEDFVQEIYGFDLEYSIRHLHLVGEFAVNRWEVPNIADAQGRPQDLENYGWYLESKYKLRPGLFSAVRYSGLRFGKIDDGSDRGKKMSWDYDVDRWELGLGYYLTDGALSKLVWQLLSTDHPDRADEHLLALQLSTSF
jgi:hypothetical protein